MCILVQKVQLLHNIGEWAGFVIADKTKYINWAILKAFFYFQFVLLYFYGQTGNLKHRNYFVIIDLFKWCTMLANT